MLRHIALGALLFTATTAVHGGATALALALLRRSHAERWGFRSRRRATLMISGFVTLMFLASVVEVALWAAVYLAAGAVTGWEPALYFSTVTFTTLGYGDVVLQEDWRLLASFEAMNGIVLFGWTTALVVMLIQRVGERLGEGTPRAPKGDRA